MFSLAYICCPINDCTMSYSRYCLTSGEIKLNDITTVMPFSDTVDLVELRGHHLLEVLERSVEEYDLIILPGFFLQYSGKQYLIAPV